MASPGRRAMAGGGRVHLCTIALLGLTMSSVSSPAARAGACAPMEDPVRPGVFLGCCDGSGQVRANGAPCLYEGNSCLQGTCSGGACTALTQADNRDHPPCVDPNDICRRGACWGAICKSEDGHGKPDAAVCASDNNVCTVDCQPDNTTAFPLDALCGPFPLTGPTCSVPLAGPTCQLGTCVGGACTPGAGATATCSGSPSSDCEELVCVQSLGVHCEARPKEVGTPCDVAHDLPDDCHLKQCQIGSDGRGVCHDFGGTLAGLTCEDGDGRLCTRGVCNGRRQCAHVVNLTDGTRCPGTTLGECGEYLCASGVCDRHPVNDGAPCSTPIEGACRLAAPATCQSGACLGPLRADGTVCDDGNPCTDASTCQTGNCVATHCNAEAMCIGCGMACNAQLPLCGCVPIPQ